MAVDLSNLKQIAQAALIYAEDHDGNLPVANTVTDYALMLSTAGIMTDPTLWVSGIDPASETVFEQTFLFDAKKPSEAEAALKIIKPSIAVPLGVVTVEAPQATPIAWTRGLQADGTWAKHSPYGSRGGYIAFLSGQVRFFENLNENGGQLSRFKGNGTTGNIFEALPPDVHIGEYNPSPEEMTLWAKQRRLSDPIPWYDQPLTWLLVVIWTPSLLIACIRKLQRRSTIVSKRLVYWPLSISVIILLFLAIGLC